MTTDPVQTSVSAPAPAPITKSPSKSPARDRSPDRLVSPSEIDNTTRPVSPSKVEPTDLAPSVAAESCSFTKTSTATSTPTKSPTKTFQSPVKMPGSPVASVFNEIVPVENVAMAQPETEFEPAEAVVAAAGLEAVSTTALDKTPLKRSRLSTNGAPSSRKKSVGSVGSSIASRKSISAATLVRAESFSVGDLVFAHVKGHPWWPALILEEKDVPEKFLKERRTPKERCIMFYNSDQYGFLADEYLVPFAPNVEALATNASVKKAIKEAEENPNVIFDRIENIKKMSTEDEIEYEDDEYDGDRRSLSTKARKTSINKTPKSTKRRATDDEDRNASKRSKTELTPHRTSKRKAGIEALMPLEGPNDMLMRWRHALQKTFIKDKSIGDKPRISPETIHTVDFENIKAVLDEFYEYMMGPMYNADDVAKTKLHKVVRLIAASSAMTDSDSLLLEHNIPALISRLMDALRFRSEGSGIAPTAEVTEHAETDQ